MDAMKGIGWLAVVAAIAVALPLPSGAQTVQKCVARDGHVRYRSAPCGRRERTAEVWDATPEPVAPPEVDVAPPPVRGSTRRRRVVRSSQLERRIAKSTGDACERARAYRDAVERRAGLDRDYELLSALQRRVFDACR